MVNKMLIVLPCMLLFNQLDQTDEVLMGLFRLAFFTYSAIAAGCFWLAQQRISEANDQRKFWVKPAGAFFQAEQPAVEVTFAEHEMAKAKEGLNQAVMSALMMAFFSFKMGLQMPVMLQCVLGPLSLFEAPVFQKHILRSTENPWPVVPPPGEAAATTAAAPAAQATGAAALTNEIVTVSDAIRVTWDTSKVDIDAIAAAVARPGANVNFASSPDGYTLLMVCCGVSDMDAPRVARLLKLGADRFLVDKDGWTALHWAAFQGVSAVVAPLMEGLSLKRQLLLLGIKSTDGKTALEVAEGEHDNAATVAELHRAMEGASGSSSSSSAAAATPEAASADATPAASTVKSRGKPTPITEVD